MAKVAGPVAEPSRARAIRANIEPMCVRYAKEFHVSERLCDNESGTLRNLNRFIIYYFGAYLCNVDLEASRCDDVARGQQKQQQPQLPSPAFASDTEITIRPAAENTRGETLGGSDESARTRPTDDSNSPRPLFGGLPQSKWKRELRFSWIPTLLLVMFCLCEVYLLAAAYYQYGHDFDVLRLRALRRQQAGALMPAQRNNTHQLIEMVESRINATRVTLDRLGSDYTHMTILAGCFYMCVILLAFIVHLPIYLHHRYQRPFDQCHIVRDLLDQKRENKLNVRMVHAQVDKFLESSRVHYANLVEFPDTPIGVWQATAKLSIDLFRRKNAFRRAVSSLGVEIEGRGEDKEVKGEGGATWRRNIDSEIPEMVREMLAIGALVPLYKLRSWVRKRTLLQFVHHLVLGVYTISFHVALNWGFYSLANHERPQGQQSTHALLQIACLGPLIISTPSVALQPPITMMIAREQIHYLGQLRRMTRACILQNFRIANLVSRRNRLPQRASTGSSSIEVTAYLQVQKYKLERTLNSNLVFVILHYKIFVAQLTPMLLTLGVQFVIGFAVLITVPIIVRIHIPYMRQLYEDKLTETQIRIFAIVISASGVVPINMLTVPVCHMYVECQRLYRDLNSLAAHIAEVKSWPGCANFYDDHVQTCLTKELSDPIQLLGQLTARAGPISGTYKNLVKALFWFGLILVSFVADKSSATTGNKDYWGSLLNDPLGVYYDI